MMNPPLILRTRLQWLMRWLWNSTTGKISPLITRNPVKYSRNSLTAASGFESDKKSASYALESDWASALGRGAMRKIPTSINGSQLSNNAQLKMMLRNPIAIRMLRKISLLSGFSLNMLLEKLEGVGLQLVELGLDFLSVDSLTAVDLDNDLSELGDLLGDVLDLGGVELLLELLERLLGVGTELVGLVDLFDGLLSSLILLLELLGIVDHLLDLGVGKSRRTGNSDGVVLARGLVLGRNVDDSVSVNVKGDLDLWNTLWSWWNTRKSEVTNELVVSNKFSLTLEHSDLDRGLARGSGGEHLRLLGWDSGVSWDQSGEDTTQGLNTERQWSNVQKQNVLDLTGQDSTLNGSTNGNSLVWVHSLGWLLTKERLDSADNLWHSGHTTNKNNLGNLGGGQTGILQSLLDRLDGLLDQWLNQLLELGSGHLQVDVLWTRSIGSDERKVDLGGHSGGQLDLGLLGSFSDSLDGHSVVLEVDTRLLLEGVNNVSDKSDIEILTTQVGVTVGGLDLENTVVNVQDGDIEGTSTQVEDGNDVAVVLLKTVGKSGGGWLVDNSGNVQTNNGTGILGGLSLGVVEVSWNGNDGVLGWLSKVGLGSLLHLVEDETSDLGWRVFLASSLNPGVTVGVLDDLVRNLLQVSLDLLVLESSTDQSLGSEQGVLWVDNSLSLGWNTNESLAVLGESHNGRSGSGTLGILDDSWSLTFHDGNGRVGGTQINTDHGTTDLGRVVSHLFERRLGG
ncbi:hypothetical protein OGAPHI_004698 [Ogataea philodendri]|uniref:Uncharacterized protein n=1 Tax=Ogataea philodendri TaxID=1378263 RepID=A0A9P8P2P1_9ASCO|nr:uncharacterized protein OGAPHI_004698 [Ogataea philodendri]KAH3663984.1 hypothetical protein OGAPHI_004698 [Ogataea philodendri]